jgi:hypothetical protein
MTGIGNAPCRMCAGTTDFCIFTRCRARKLLVVVGGDWGAAYVECGKEVQMTPTTPLREPRSDYELDDVATKAQLATLDRLIKEREQERRRIRSDYELDDVESKVLIKTWEKALARDKAKRKGETR